MTTVNRVLRAILGVLIGAAGGLLGAILARAVADEQLFIGNLPLVAVTLAGLVLGWRTATAAFVAALLTLLGVGLLDQNPVPMPADLLRLATFVIAAPIIVWLLRTAQISRRAAVEARDGAQRAQRLADAERQRFLDAGLRLDAALASAERERARLEEVAEAIPEPLIVYDDQLRGTYGNRAALRVFGRSFVERPLDDWGRATEPRDEQGNRLTRDEWPQVRAQTTALRERLTMRVPMTGRDIMLDIEGTPIPGGGAILMLRDIGKEEDQRRRLSRFASFVAHELRNPLAVAKARIELAQRDPDLPPRAGNHGSRALESVDAAIGILEHLELDSRADSGRIEAERQPFELAPALGAAIERLRARGSERELLADLPPRVMVVGDRHLSEQAITNLLINADRYSTPGTPIHVEVEPNDPVVLRVRDEGPGIADEVAHHLFRDRITAGRGLGLGLYLVHATMTAMGGSVHLEERRPGTVFALRWARAPD